MGSSPIARSIFLVLILFTFSEELLAQVEPDPSRPFGQGEVLLLPGTNSYVGDLPHSVSVLEDPAPFHTVSGSLATEVGWLNSVGTLQPGLRNFTPGILFEGISYPFTSIAPLDLMPQAGRVTVLDLPASAWWGPSASAGAIFLEPAAIKDQSTNNLSIWGSDGSPVGGEDLFQNPLLSLEGNYQHGNAFGLGGSENLDVLSKERWVANDTGMIESGFLGMRSGPQINWYAAFADLKLYSPNFQTLEVKPYFQSAQLGSLTAQDVGGFMNYLLNLGGLVEGHLGAGFDHEDLQSGMGPSQINRGFVQATDLVDVLGPINFDSAFRFDFSTVADTQFSALLGIQMVQDSFTFSGDYAKGVLGQSLGDVQQLELGVSFQPSSNLKVGTQYIHLLMAGENSDGCRLEMDLEHADPVLFVFRNIKIKVAEQIFQNLDGTLLYDTGGKLAFSPISGLKLTFRGRALSGQGLFGEVEGDYSATDQISLFVSLANLNNLPMTWPDVTESPGRVLWAGVHGQF